MGQEITLTTGAGRTVGGLPCRGGHRCRSRDRGPTGMMGGTRADQGRLRPLRADTIRRDGS